MKFDNQPVKIGAVAEYGIWLSGEETQGQRAQFEVDCKEAMRRFAEKHGVLLSPAKFTEKKPGEDRVPQVPNHIQGPDVRLLIVEATVLANAPRFTTKSFLMELSVKDLARLRQITRKAHGSSIPGASPLSDQECDRIIEQIGPEAAFDAVRKAVDQRIIH